MLRSVSLEEVLLPTPMPKRTEWTERPQRIRSIGTERSKRLQWIRSVRS